MRQAQHNPGKWAHATEEQIGAFITKEIPQEEFRFQVLQYFADMIMLANELNPQNWVVSLGDGNTLRLMTGANRTVSIEQGGLFITAMLSDLPDERRDEILTTYSLNWHHRNLPESQALRIPAENVSGFIPLVRDANEATIRRSSSLTKQSVWRGNHVPAAIDYLSKELGRELPKPAYPTISIPRYWKVSAQSLGHVVEQFLQEDIVALTFDQAAIDLNGVRPNSAADIRDALAREGTSIDLAPNHAPMQLWSLFSSVQIGDRMYLTYGGTIRGIGTVTGAYRFDGLSTSFQHRRDVAWERANIPISSLSSEAASRLSTSYMTLDEINEEYAHAIEHEFMGDLDVSESDEYTSWQSAYASIFPRAGLNYTPWIQAVFFTALQTKGFVILSGISGTGKTKIAQAFAAALPQPGTVQRNVEFLTVRPDWRDSKSLIGYHNPLTGTYEWTPFLRFVLRAAASWEAKDGLAWFVILDEMNLAHVEHYFAEFLSVIESGRDMDGWSREAIALQSTQANGDPPASIRLPPNLHIIGTVNLDDTTHAFSPKVLDRAFAIEFSDVSFAGYLTESLPPAGPHSTSERASMLRALSGDGAYPRIDKQRISARLAQDGRPRAWLESLNVALHRHQLHFGFRVFDEIVAFVDYGVSNRLFDELAPDGDVVAAAFDAAAMMKVLPKFHGPRSRLDLPLRNVISWCTMENFASMSPVHGIIEQAHSPSEMEASLLQLNYRFPHTADRAIKLLWLAYTEGFAAFG